MIQQIEKLKEIINQNSMGHLPLPYRVDLMKQIGDTRTVQKVLCECCKKSMFLLSGGIWSRKPVIQYLIGNGQLSVQ